MADFWVVDDGLLYHGPGGVARTALFSRCVQALRLLDALETMADPLVDARGVSQKLRGRPLRDTRGATSTRIDDPEAHCIRCGARANVVVFDVGAMCAKHADEERGIERPGTIRVPRGEPIDTSKIPWDRVDITLAPEDRPRPKETPGPGGPPRVGTANTS